MADDAPDGGESGGETGGSGPNIRVRYDDPPSPIVDIGDANPDAIEQQYNIDITNLSSKLYKAPDSVDNPRTASFFGLADSEVGELHDSLRLQYGNHAVEHLLHAYDEWKETSHPDAWAPPRVEQLYKEALGLDTPIRRDPDGKSLPKGPYSEEQLELLQAVYHVTQAFVQQHYSGRISIFRGLRDQTVAELFAQILDSPDSRYVLISADTVLNASTEAGPALDISNSGVRLELVLPAPEIFALVDQIRTGDEPYSDEVHIQGGMFGVPQQYIVTVGPEDSIQQSLKEVVDRMGISSMSKQMHEAVFELVLRMADNEVYPGTERGCERLTSWMNVVRTTSQFSQENRRGIGDIVRILSSPRPDEAFWLEQKPEDWSR